jgi:hypothetical protein
LLLVPTPEAVAVSVEPAEDGPLVRVVANALAKDLCLFPDRLDAAARVDTGRVEADRRAGPARRERPVRATHLTGSVPPTTVHPWNTATSAARA